MMWTLAADFTQIRIELPNQCRHRQFILIRIVQAAHLLACIQGEIADLYH